MGKKELKEQNKDLVIHVVDVINKFDPSNSSKFTGFLIKKLKEHLDDRKSTLGKPSGRFRGRLREVILEGGNSNIKNFSKPIGDNDLENNIIYYLTECYGRENLESLHLFNEHLKENRIPQGYRDINNYDSWEEIQKVTSLATIKLDQKRLEKEVMTVIDNEEWLVIRPLTIESSLTYGSGTKWCTASKNNHDYFYRYAKNGVLNYVINKVDGEKYGVYYDINANDFSIWDAPDRRIDSVESTMPFEIINTIYKISKIGEPNYNYFSELEKLKCDSYYSNKQQEEELVTPIEDEVRGDQADTDEDEEVVTHYMDLQDNTITTREQIHNEAHFFEGLEPYQNLPGIGS